MNTQSSHSQAALESIPQAVPQQSLDITASTIDDERARFKSFMESDPTLIEGRSASGRSLLFTSRVCNLDYM